MSSVFKFYIPLNKEVAGQDYLEGVASTISLDRDGERMSENALQDMQREIIANGVNLFGNHEHNWENTLGCVNKAELKGTQLHVGIKLDDASTNPKIPMLLNKMRNGIKLGLSVGGSVTKERWENDKTLGKRVKVIDGVKLFEVSVVGIPSNADSYMSIPYAISKSASLNKSKTCPCCYSKLWAGECEVCLWKHN